MSTIDPTFTALAQDYLATKERTPHYEIRSISDICPADGWCNLQSFSEEEMTQLLALREKYGKEEFFNHLDEVFDEDTLHDMVYGSEIISFDLDRMYFKYNFTYHEITDKGVQSGTIKLNLTDEIYVKLLALHLENRNLTINSLRYADRDLYKKVTRYVDSCFCYDGAYEVCNPYTITMDEFRADAQKIREQHPDKFHDEYEMIGYFIY